MPGSTCTWTVCPETICHPYNMPPETIHPEITCFQENMPPGDNLPPGDNMPPETLPQDNMPSRQSATYAKPATREKCHPIQYTTRGNVPTGTICHHKKGPPWTTCHHIHIQIWIVYHINLKPSAQICAVSLYSLWINNYCKHLHNLLH